MSNELKDTYTSLFAKKRFNESEQFLLDNLLMEVVMGSQAYGCATPESDLDVVGLVMNKHEHLYPQSYGYVLGFDDVPNFKNKCVKGPTKRLSPEESGTKELEGEWNSLTNFFFLAGKKGSPSAVEVLFVKRNLVKFAHPVTWMLRDNRKLFLSMKTFHAFKGYAFQQLSRMKRNLKAFDENGTCDNANRLDLYEKYGYDTKMAYHPLRLLDLCHQLLTENDLDLMRNKKECQAMRAGEWGTFERFEEHVLTKLSNLEDLATKTSLVSVPQTQPLHNLLQNCVEEFYGSDDAMKRQGTEYVSAKDVMERLDRMEKLLK